MKFLQKRTGIAILLLLCICIGLFVMQKDEAIDSESLLDGCDMLNQGISSQFLHPGREEYHQFNNCAGSRIVFEEYRQDEELKNKALLAIDYYVVNEKIPNNFDMDAILNRLFSVEFDLEYKALSDSAFELLELEVTPKAKGDLTSLLDIKVTTEPSGTKLYGEPIAGTLQIKLEDASWGIIYNFDWTYEILIDEYNHISLKLFSV